MYYRFALIGGFYLASVAAAWIIGGNNVREAYEAKAAKELAAHLQTVRKVERESTNAERSLAAAAEQRERALQDKYVDAIARIGPIRMCVAPPAYLPDAALASGSDEASAERNKLPSQAGKDIAPELVELTKIADDQAAQLLTCNEYAGAMERYIKSIAPASTNF